VIHEGVEAIYKEYGHYLYERCRVLLGNDDEAYDALQEVFIRLMRSRPSLDRDRTVLPWLNRVTTNHCLNRLRARRYRRHLPLDQVFRVPDQSSTAFLHQLSEHRNVIRRLLAATDERTQKVVVAYFFDEHGVDQIANDLRISVPTVRRVLSRFLSRARKKLRAECERAVSGGSEV